MLEKGPLFTSNFSGYKLSCTRIASGRQGILVPPLSDSNFCDKIRGIIAKESVDVIYPCDNLFTSSFARIRETFSKIGVNVVASDPETVNICLDKWQMYQSLGNTVAMPRSTVELDIKHILDYVGLPAFIKPRDSSGSKNAYKINDREDLRYYLKKVKNPIVQEFISGVPHITDILVDM